jgi:excisionase family DNA binding protein
MERYFTVEEIAKYLNYAEKTIRKRVLNQEIPYIKIHQTIRFQLSDIQSWINTKKINSIPWLFSGFLQIPCPCFGIAFKYMNAVILSIKIINHISI